MSEGPFIEDHIGAPFSIVTFENYSYIFGVEAELDARTNRQSDSGGSDDKCALLFFGENSNIVLTSNAVRSDVIILYCIAVCSKTLAIDSYNVV